MIISTKHKMQLRLTGMSLISQICGLKLKDKLKI